VSRRGATCLVSRISSLAGSATSREIRDTSDAIHRRAAARHANRLALAVLLLLSACDSLPGRPTEAQRPLRPAQVVDFSQLYSANCAGCHGADGRLAAARPLNDSLYLHLAGRDVLRRVTAQGVADSLMPGFALAAGGTLTDQQIDVIVGGMFSQWAGKEVTLESPAPPYAATGRGDAQRGAAAYATYCAGCHGADGTGGPRGGSIIDGSYLALVSDQALRTAVIFGRKDLGMPNWQSDVANRAMTDGEVTDVVAWMVAQRPQFPGQPYQ
jgi:cytochrome c oxidase cbb3-type subunit III